MSTAYDAIIRAASDRHGIPFAILKGLIAHESRFDPKAGRTEVLLKDRSLGLTQILLATAKGEGYTGEAAGLLDPATNIEYGARYLARQYRRVGKNWPAAFSAYNGGYRPEIAFGVRATKPGRVCLARDQKTGACVRWYDYKVGEFGNQPYVDAVLREARRYGYSDTAPAPPAVPPPSAGGGLPPTSAAGRSSALYVAALTLGLGLLWAAWRARAAM